MKARPILFSGPMVLALLEGRKTQTRRIVKPGWKETPHCDLGTKWASVWKSGTWHTWDTNGVGGENWKEDTFEKAQEQAMLSAIKQGFFPCPYGRPGDLLWARETLWVVSEGFEYAADDELASEVTDSNADLWARYAHEDGPDVHPTRIPSIFMPRWASRLTLPVAEVRVERLNDISEADAIAEGAGISIHEYPQWHGDSDCYRKIFQERWKTIHGPDAWANNPWVWVVKFSIERANVDNAILPKPLQPSRESA